MPLPLMLAGPILRRVEPTLVSVWVALREASTMDIQLWTGLVQDDSDAQLFSGSASQEVKGALVHTASTIRIGDQLHIGVITLKLPSQNPLLPNFLYSYNITIQTASGTHDFKSLGLLKTGEVDGKPNLSLGYDPNFLPSFALAPIELTDLRILHGSCRKPNRNVPDGLAWVGDFIEESRTDPKARPHQLLLTGDQIYADDVDDSFLYMLIQTAKDLIGGKEQLPAAGKLWSADEIHFPPRFRLSLTQAEAKFTSSDGHSHLLSLGDFCAMYLYVWCNACWPSIFPTEEELMQQMTSLPWVTSMRDELKAFIRGVEEDHEEKQRLSDLYRLGKIPAADFQTFLAPDAKLPKLFSEEKKEQKLSDFKSGASLHLLHLKQVWMALPKIRQALANVPTYMMFDDHEVTDDWYLNPVWRDRVLTSPLGKTIVRNGLLSYALFQGWGNDPVRFESGPNKELLDQATKLFPKNADGPNETAGNAIDVLLGLNLRDTNQAPPVKWHYSVKGSRHLLVAFDNRTRRSFVSRLGPPGNVSGEALIEQLPEGPLPAGLEVLVLVAPLPVIGPPVLDELVAPLSYRVFDLTGRNNIEKHPGSKGMAGTNPDAIEAWAFDPISFEALLKRLEPYRRVVILSGDVHYGSSQAMSYWKKGDTEPARFAQFISSGMKNVMPWYIRFADRSFAFAQRVIRANIGTERLGWNVRLPLPLSFPQNFEVASSLQSRLRREPIHVSGEALPDDTLINRAPDFQWRVQVLRDTRTDEQRPDAAHVEPIDPADPKADAVANLEGYRRVVVRHAKQLTQLLNSRQILFANNLGRLRFENLVEDEGRKQTLIAMHELYTAFPAVGAATLEKAELFTLHRVAMSDPGEEKPDERFKS